MAAKTTPPADPKVTIIEPAKPVEKPPVLGELPSAFAPTDLARLATARDALRGCEDRASRALAAKQAADHDHDVAVAALNDARKRALDAATSLLGADLADNFIAITDEESERLGRDAQANKRGVPEHVKAKLFG